MCVLWMCFSHEMHYATDVIYLIGAGWCIYASLCWVIPFNGLAPFRRKAITLINDDLLMSIGPLGTKLSDILIEIKPFSLKKIAFENTVCQGGGPLVPISMCYINGICTPLQWRHDGFDSVSNHQPRHCLLNHLVRRRSKKTSKLCTQMASNAENISIWWRHHDPDIK